MQFSANVIYAKKDAESVLLKSPKAAGNREAVKPISVVPRSSAADEKEASQPVSQPASHSELCAPLGFLPQSLGSLHSLPACNSH